MTLPKSYVYIFPFFQPQHFGDKFKTMWKLCFTFRHYIFKTQIWLPKSSVHILSFLHFGDKIITMRKLSFFAAITFSRKKYDFDLVSKQFLLFNHNILVTKLYQWESDQFFSHYIFMTKLWLCHDIEFSIVFKPLVIVFRYEIWSF